VDLTMSGWQMLYTGFGIALLTAFLSYFSCKVVMGWALKSGMIAVPGPRQSHLVATPTGGGLGLVFSILAAYLLLWLFLGLPPGWLQGVMSLIRLLIQLAVSLCLLTYAPLQFSLTDLSLFLTAIFTIVWLMNLYNFMDGSNGMAGFQGVFAGVVFAFLFYLEGQVEMALLALVMAAACLGFLPLNFPRARVFMGDVASVPLGFLIASFSIYGIATGSVSISLAFLISSVFVIDATLTLLARVISRERWYTAHAQHVYQRLIAHGWSHQRVLAVYQVINAGLVLPAVVLAKGYPQFAVQIVVITSLLLVSGWQIANKKLGGLAEVRIK
jgi:Fuc2NAc and GlcNAc transferase